MCAPRFPEVFRGFSLRFHEVDFPFFHGFATFSHVFTIFSMVFTTFSHGFSLRFHGFTVLNSPQKGLIVPLKAGATVIHQGFTLGIITPRLLLSTDQHPRNGTYYTINIYIYIIIYIYAYIYNIYIYIYIYILYINILYKYIIYIYTYMLTLPPETYRFRSFCVLHCFTTIFVGFCLQKQPAFFSFV